MCALWDVTRSGHRHEADPMTQRSRRSEPPLHPVLMEFADGLGRLLANMMLARRRGQVVPQCGVPDRAAQQPDGGPPPIQAAGGPPTQRTQRATEGAELTIKTSWGVNSAYSRRKRHG